MKARPWLTDRRVNALRQRTQELKAEEDALRAETEELRAKERALIALGERMNTEP
jgi:cell division protein FtsB